ncbi:MAG: FtsX-like permease family protein [Firmicutes bacterium]|nr:FtsX-like permease family protein [Bacillota bacterium]
MNLLESIRVALEAMWANKLRAGLTMLGIIIGVAAVILVVAIGQGGKAKLMSELEKIGTNLFIVYTEAVSSDTVRQDERITLDDIDAIQDKVKTVKAIAPSSYEYAETRTQYKSKQGMIIGTTASYQEVFNLKLKQGSFFSDSDARVGRRAAVINPKMAEDLFGTASPIGQRIVIRSVPVTVIGVSEEGSSMMGPNRQGQAIIPRALWEDIFASNRVDEIEGKAISKETVDSTIKDILNLLHKRHHNNDRYKAFNLEQQMESANKAMEIVTMVIGAIAGISLVVGGIGVMNIMLVSVTERTREIGIRIAVGAKRRDILRQFLIEAVVLSLVGGIVGLMLGTGLSALFSAVLELPFGFSLSTLLLAFGFSSAVGIFFGIYPASKAAKLSPIEALRYE